MALESPQTKIYKKFKQFPLTVGVKLPDVPRPEPPLAASVPLLLRERFPRPLWEAVVAKGEGGAAKAHLKEESTKRIRIKMWNNNAGCLFLIFFALSALQHFFKKRIF